MPVQRCIYTHSSLLLSDLWGFKKQMAVFKCLRCWYAVIEFNLTLLKSISLELSKNSFQSVTCWRGIRILPWILYQSLLILLSRNRACLSAVPTWGITFDPVFLCQTFDLVYSSQIPLLHFSILSSLMVLLFSGLVSGIPRFHGNHKPIVWNTLGWLHPVSYFLEEKGSYLFMYTTRVGALFIF